MGTIRVEDNDPQGRPVCDSNFRFECQKLKFGILSERTIRSGTC